MNQLSIHSKGQHISEPKTFPGQVMWAQVRKEKNPGSNNKHVFSASEIDA